MIEQNTGDIKLVDFGFAKDLSKAKRGNLDRTFTKCGTPGYTAPEVLLQEEGSNIFDIYIDDDKNNSPLRTTTFEQNYGISVGCKLEVSLGLILVFTGGGHQCSINSWNQHSA